MDAFHLPLHRIANGIAVQVTIEAVTHPILF